MKSCYCDTCERAMKFHKREYSGDLTQLEDWREATRKRWTKTWGIRNCQWVSGGSRQRASISLLVGESTGRGRESFDQMEPCIERIFVDSDCVLKALKNDIIGYNLHIRNL